MELIDYIRCGKYKRINVVGCPGSGKSTVAKLITDNIGYPLFDLDDVFYNNGCKRKSYADTLSEVNQIIANEYFVIDGTYTSSFEHRLTRVDLVVFINKPTITCLYQFFKRLFLKSNLKCGERLTRKTFKLLLSFNRTSKKKIKTQTEAMGIELYYLN